MSLGGSTRSISTREHVGALASFRADTAAGVFSLYLDLEPSEFAIPKARIAEVESLADAARQRYTDDEEHRPLELDSPVARTVERVRSYLESEFAPNGARGVAVFASEDPELFVVIRLRHPVEGRVVLAERPFVRPLLEAPPSLDGWVLLMVNRRAARLLAGRGGSLEEVAGFTDVVHGRHDQGGWSQPRYQRHIEKQVKDHVQHTCQELFEYSRRERVERLVLATTEEVGPLVDSALHPYLASVVAGRLTADIEAAQPDQLGPEVLKLAVRDREESDHELLEQLAVGLAHGERAVAGLPPVLNALNLHSVAVLMACPDLVGSAMSCPTCGWLGQDQPTCPVDGTQTKPRDDVLEAAVESALDQDAAVRLLNRDDVRRKGCAAALLRFDIG
jgi:peptide chain release factor subunit 1